MYRKIDDFVKDWDYETETTVKIFNDLTDESLKTKVYPEGRDLGFIAWHIVLSLGEMITQAGLKPSAPAENSEQPKSAKKISEEFKLAADSVKSEVVKNWNDEELSKKLKMYGEEWEKGSVLNALIKHQTHHRGQMTILMRQAGLKVHGAYGPAKEEWVNFGMEPQK